PGVAPKDEDSARFRMRVDWKPAEPRIWRSSWVLVSRNSGHWRPPGEGVASRRPHGGGGSTARARCVASVALWRCGNDVLGARDGRARVLLARAGTDRGLPAARRVRPVAGAAGAAPCRE